MGWDNENGFRTAHSLINPPLLLPLPPNQWLMNYGNNVMVSYVSSVARRVMASSWYLRYECKVIDDVYTEQADEAKETVIEGEELDCGAHYPVRISSSGETGGLGY